jgi:hypothetical protein
MIYAGAGNYEACVCAHYRCGGMYSFISLQETFLLDDKEKTMEGDGYVIARICSIVIVILIGSSRNHFPLSSLLCPTIWVGFCLH